MTCLLKSLVPLYNCPNGLLSLMALTLQLIKQDQIKQNNHNILDNKSTSLRNKGAIAKSVLKHTVGLDIWIKGQVGAVKPI